MEPVQVFPELRFFLSSPLSSPAIAVFEAIFPAQKHRHFFFGPNLPAFFPAQICRHFVSIRYYWHFFRPEFADIFSGPNLPTFFSGPKLPAYFATRNFRHISLREIAGIFFDTKLRHLNLHLLPMKINCS